jgi:hypothetical protein
VSFFSYSSSLFWGISCLVFLYDMGSYILLIEIETRHKLQWTCDLKDNPNPIDYVFTRFFFFFFFIIRHSSCGQKQVKHAHLPLFKPLQVFVFFKQFPLHFNEKVKKTFIITSDGSFEIWSGMIGRFSTRTESGWRKNRKKKNSTWSSKTRSKTRLQPVDFCSFTKTTSFWFKKN